MSLQALDRAIAVLQAVAQARDGLRFTQVQEALGLSKPSTHRLLASLLEHGLLRRDRATRAYRLGPALGELAQHARPEVPDLRTLGEGPVQRLAEASGDTVFLSGCEGLHTVCLARATGGFPIRAITVEVGSRRPLGVGAGGLAILGAMPADDAERTVQVLRPRYREFTLTSAAHVMTAQRLARRQGYALSDERVASGVRGVALALLDPQGKPVGAIGIAAIRSRVSAARIPELLAMLRQERDLIGRKLREQL